MQNKENSKYKGPEVGAFFTAKGIARRRVSWSSVSKGRVAEDRRGSGKYILELFLDHGKGFGFAE